MANQTIAKLTAPTITLEGIAVSPSKEYTTGTWAVTAGILESPNSNDSSSKEFSIENGRVERTLVFDGGVDIRMTVSGHTLKTRSNTSVPDSRPTFYGDLSGVLNDSPQTDFAEIRYTVNGKDPSRTKFYRWGIDNGDAIKLQMNKTGGSETVLKARTYYRGRWSDPTSVRIRIAKGTTLSQVTNQVNASSTGRDNVVGDPAEGQELATDNS